MHPDPPHDPARDAVLDGRDSLRLVQLPLGPTPLPVALLPIAAVSPLVRAVAEEARVNHHARLTDQASATVQEVRREITTVRGEIEAALTNEAIVVASEDEATAAERRSATDQLAEIAKASEDVVVAVS